MIVVRKPIIIIEVIVIKVCEIAQIWNLSEKYSQKLKKPPPPPPPPIDKTPQNAGIAL